MKKLLALVMFVLAVPIVAQADEIITDFDADDRDIIPTTGNEVQSGNGLLDFYLFDGATSLEENQCDGFDGDDSNTEMPGGGETTTLESYITSMGELQLFYDLCFPGESVTDIAIYLDLNEEGSDAHIYLDALTVVVGYDPIYGDLRDDPASGDIDSETQNLTNNNYSGGVDVAWLDSSSPVLLPVNEQGAGWADYAIVLGINPYDYSPDTRVLIHWQSHDHTDGSDTIFISGEYWIPEPGSLSLLLCGSLALMRRRRH
jgi:hypothetical protein